ncbi:MAG: 50S ribosomal protein L16 [Chlamydiae bacterium]|nr:50S ribosomal protein L16 [Chlamydiota bacterium]MBI3277739.1 50S ribosomal protein L16 [Chlamydiota bacterium]
MPLMPSRVKFRKMHKGCRSGKASRATRLSFGEYGLQSLDRGWITNIQLEAIRVAIARHMKRKGKIWLRLFPDKPITKKPAETRMGKGKGPPSGWVIVVRPGNVLLEIEGVTESIAKEALRLAAYKLPLKTRFIVRQHV